MVLMLDDQGVRATDAAHGPASAAPGAARLAACVVICTFNRPAMFAATLRSCLRDASAAGLPFEVVVADNSRDAYAAGVVAAVRAELPACGVPVRVVTASPPNISLARNAGLRAASAPLVAFLDDDLVVEPGWLDALVGVLAATGADAALGPVRPVFPAGSPPDWDPTGARFTRVLAQPTGTPIQASGPAAGLTVSTASSIWRAATCFTDAEPFDPAFGGCGGEDLDLFVRLRRRGARFVWCAEAGVHETIPAGRMELAYQRLRAYSGSQAFSAVTIKNAPSRPKAWLSLGLRGLAQVLAFGPPALALMLADGLGSGRLGEHGVRMIFNALVGWGKLTWWRLVPLYQIERPPE
jgi:succinoglycan biosynthesis protein ExoM